MLRSNILKIAKVKYFFILLASKTFLALLVIDETILSRIVTDLHLKKLSYNEIREHINSIYHIDITKHKIKEILRKAGKKAKEIKKRIKHKIRTKNNTIEVKEWKRFVLKHELPVLTRKWDKIDLNYVSIQEKAKERTKR